MKKKDVQYSKNEEEKLNAIIKDMMKCMIYDETWRKRQKIGIELSKRKNNKKEI